MRKISDYINEKRVIEVQTILEMAQINNKDNGRSVLNPSAYQVIVKNNEGEHRVPHFHIKSKNEGWEIKLYISSGELYQVERYGNRNRTDTFRDIVSMAKKWMKQNSSAFGMTDKKNYEVALIQWRMLNPDNDQSCEFTNDIKG